ncbi:conserved hypothetical protein [Ricinus communis]|uniref:Uncharacterized protein n=1 Tax=Ricinus communis TaxID=3988 RepID=B9SQC5_RICCO|nr:conserved hypothetical protein [Ricinus communis]
MKTEARKELTSKRSVKSSGPELQERKNRNTHKKNSSLPAKNDIIWIFLTTTSKNCWSLLSLGVNVLEIKENRMGMRVRRERRRRRRRGKVRL